MTSRAAIAARIDAVMSTVRSLRGVDLAAERAPAFADGEVARLAAPGLALIDDEAKATQRAFLAAHGGTSQAMLEGSFLESSTGVRAVNVGYKACAPGGDLADMRRRTPIVGAPMDRHLSD